MLSITKLNKKKMNLNDILNYIKENSPQKIDKEETTDILNSEQKVIGRNYTAIDKYGIKEKFTIMSDEVETYLTHTTENPYQELELEDEY